MADDDCVRFLQWALPQLSLRWPGFRKPRRQVCRRLLQRCRELSLPDLAAYQARLQADPDEWAVLDPLCRVTISRFWRDHSVWNLLVDEVLPELARQARQRGSSRLRAWSCGCASGEEAGTLSIAWRLGVGESDLPLEVVGTDIDPAVLERARRACYPEGSVHGLPVAWRTAAFADTGEDPDRFCLREALRQPLSYRLQDVRQAAPPGSFDLVLCRNLAFTYFAEPLQREVLTRLVAALHPGGALVLGRSEALPEVRGLEVWNAREAVFRKQATRPPRADPAHR